MKLPKLQNLEFSSIQPNGDNYRNPNEYFPKGEEERIGMGKGILAGGIQGMTPIRVSKRVKDKVETQVVIGGNRRYWALESQDAKILAELSVPCLVYSGLTEVEELEISMSDNEGFVAISPWGNCKVVERLSKLGKSQSDIAERFNWSVPQVGNLLNLTRVEPWVRTAGEQGKIAASLVWQLYNSCKGKKEEKLSALNVKLAEKRELIESQGVTAKDFNVKEQTEVSQDGCFVFPLGTTTKVQELVKQALASKETDTASKIYTACYEVCDKSIKSILAIDKGIGETLFAELSAATKSLEGSKTLELYQAVTGTLRQLQERSELKLKELQAFANDLVREELLQKENSNTITPEERTKLASLQQGKVESKGDLAPATPDTSGLKQGNNVKGPPIDDSFTVKTTMFLTNLILLCDRAIVTEKKTPGQVLDSLRATVRKACHDFQAEHKLVE